MHDIKAIRGNSQHLVEGLRRRGVSDPFDAVADLLKQDRQLRDVLLRVQGKLAQRNDLSKKIGAALSKKDQSGADFLRSEVEALKIEIHRDEVEQRYLETKLRNSLAIIPNIPASDVPNGIDESDNVPVYAREFGAPNRNLNPAKQHFEIGEALGLMDFERAAKVSGARFVYLKGDLARLERALASFMLDTHTKLFEYTEVSPPLMVRDEAMFGTGQLPKFEDDLYFSTEVSRPKRGMPKQTLELLSRDNRGNEPDIVINFDDLRSWLSEVKYYSTKDASPRWTLRYANRLVHYSPSAKVISKKKWLIPTAEVPLTNYVREEILNEAELPLRFAAHTPCFRAEAGAAGRDTRGMIRMHQFSKVELVSITTPDQSNAEHERMTDAAQEILKKLDLAHRVVTLCAGDMGFGARKTYDIEVWLPGQNAFREISSCSNCGDFQARRMNTRFRNADGKVAGPVHTLNGSGLAVGRTLVAILENYQQPDGSIAVPAVLQPYMGGKTKIG